MKHVVGLFKTRSWQSLDRVVGYSSSAGTPAIRPRYGVSGRQDRRTARKIMNPPASSATIPRQEAQRRSRAPWGLSRPGMPRYRSLATRPRSSGQGPSSPARRSIAGSGSRGRGLRRPKRSGRRELPGVMPILHPVSSISLGVDLRKLVMFHPPQIGRSRRFLRQSDEQALRGVVACRLYLNGAPPTSIGEPYRSQLDLHRLADDRVRIPGQPNGPCGVKTLAVFDDVLDPNQGSPADEQAGRGQHENGSEDQ